MARRGGLSPEDRELWARIARSAVPLHKSRKDIFPEAPKPRPKPAAFPEVQPFRPEPFRLGQTARTGASQPSPSAVSFSESPARQLAAQPVRMDHKTFRRMTQGKLRPEARLDLHGMTLAAAHPALTGFLVGCHARGMRLVLVITGKGRGDHGPLPTRPGALRHQVPVWLQQPPLAGIVQQIQAAHYRHGGEGAYYVYLRR